MIDRKFLNARTIEQLHAAIERAAESATGETLLRTVADTVRKEFKGKGPHLKELEDIMRRDVKRDLRDSWLEIRSKRKLIDEILQDLNISEDDVASGPSGRAYLLIVNHLSGFLETELNSPSLETRAHSSRVKKRSSGRGISR